MTTFPSTARRTTPRADALLQSAVRALGQLAFAALVVFHVWLLWTHIVAGKAFEPGTAMRWLVAVGVLAGFRALSRRGLPVLFGRRAIVLWLLVILIHCHAVWTGDVVVSDLALPETVHALSQLTGAVGVLGTLLAALLVARAAAHAPVRRLAAVPAMAAGLPSDGVTFRFAPRPPPLA